MELGGIKAGEPRTLGELYRQINLEVLELEQLPAALEEAIDTSVCLDYIQRFRIVEAINRARSFGAVNRVIRGKDVLLIDMTLKRCDWFFRQLSGPHDFVACVIPEVSFSTRKRMIAKYGRFLRDFAAGQILYDAIEELYGRRAAMPLLTACGDDFAFQKMSASPELMSKHLMSMIYERREPLALRFLEHMYRKGSDESRLEDTLTKACRKDPEFLGRIAPHLKAKEHTAPHFGHRSAKRWLRKHRNDPSFSWADFASFTGDQVAKRMLKTPDWTTMQRLLLPTDEKDFLQEGYRVVRVVSHLPPPVRSRIIHQNYETAYGHPLVLTDIDLKEARSFVLEHLVEYRSAAIQLGLLEVATAREKADLLAKLPTKHGLPALKRLLHASSDSSDRSYVLTKVLELLKENNDEHRWLEVLRYAEERLRNDRSNPVTSILSHFTQLDDVITARFTVEDWETIFKIMQRLHNEGEYISWFAERIIRCYAVSTCDTLKEAEAVMKKYEKLTGSSSGSADPHWGETKFEGEELRHLLKRARFTKNYFYHVQRLVDGIESYNRRQPTGSDKIQYPEALLSGYTHFILSQSARETFDNFVCEPLRRLTEERLFPRLLNLKHVRHAFRTRGGSVAGLCFPSLMVAAQTLSNHPLRLFTTLLAHHCWFGADKTISSRLRVFIEKRLDPNDRRELSWSKWDALRLAAVLLWTTSPSEFVTFVEKVVSNHLSDQVCLEDETNKVTKNLHERSDSLEIHDVMDDSGYDSGTWVVGDSSPRRVLNVVRDSDRSSGSSETSDPADKKEQDTHTTLPEETAPAEVAGAADHRSSSSASAHGGEAEAFGRTDGDLGGTEEATDDSAKSGSSVAVSDDKPKNKELEAKILSAQEVLIEERRSRLQCGLLRQIAHVALPEMALPLIKRLLKTELLKCLNAPLTSFSQRIPYNRITPTLQSFFTDAVGIKKRGLTNYVRLCSVAQNIETCERLFAEETNTTLRLHLFNQILRVYASEPTKSATAALEKCLYLITETDEELLETFDSKIADENVDLRLLQLMSFTWLTRTPTQDSLRQRENSLKRHMTVERALLVGPDYRDMISSLAVRLTEMDFRASAVCLFTSSDPPEFERQLRRISACFADSNLDFSEGSAELLERSMTSRQDLARFTLEVMEVVTSMHSKSQVTPGFSLQEKFQTFMSWRRALVTTPLNDLFPQEASHLQCLAMVIRTSSQKNDIVAALQRYAVAQFKRHATDKSFTWLERLESTLTFLGYQCLDSGWKADLLERILADEDVARVSSAAQVLTARFLPHRASTKLRQLITENLRSLANNRENDDVRAVLDTVVSSSAPRIPPVSDEEPESGGKRQVYWKPNPRSLAASRGLYHLF